MSYVNKVVMSYNNKVGSVAIESTWFGRTVGQYQ